MEVVINTDGASRGNPGPSSYGYIIKSVSGVMLHQESKKIGLATNNIAEYTAVLFSLKYLKDHYVHKAPHQVQVLSDSKLITEQLKGNFKIKNLKLKEIYQKIKILEFELGMVFYKHVPRSKNFLADRLANKALDERI
ncbi:ribonuclease HI family protein [Candidatus Daviesbacteria bacterium]|nr:ribonuclease HI family protein [Candidatus Daviesbacteria bacterium]